ncbi:hypothetical protein DV735_g2512, partial [Chaetothyriales sp. CBS 134920]
MIQHGLRRHICRGQKRRYFEVVSQRRNASTTPSQGKPSISPRWLSDTKARIGKCITFGMPRPLIDEASTLLRELGDNWRNFVVGIEGFLTDPRRSGADSLPVQWGDQDSMGHVNNVQYAKWCEIGRTNLTRKYGKYIDPAHQQEWNDLLTSRGIGLILKSIKLDYKFPMTWPDSISVYHKLRDRPTESSQSMILDVVILSEAKQRLAARALEDIAMYNYRTASKTSMPPFMLEQFEKTFELQEAAKRDNLQKVHSIDEKVRYLEKQSWDRPDAQEDFGNSKA